MFQSIAVSQRPRATTSQSRYYGPCNPTSKGTFDEVHPGNQTRVDSVAPGVAQFSPNPVMNPIDLTFVSQVPRGVRAKIESFKRRSGWQGKDSRAIRKADCTATLSFLSRVVERKPNLDLPRFGPSPQGGIPLTWRLGDTSFTAEFLPDDPNHVEIFVADYQYRTRRAKLTWDEAIDALLSIANEKML